MKIRILTLMMITPLFLFGIEDSLQFKKLNVYLKGDISVSIPSKQIIISDNIFESNMIGNNGRLELGGLYSTGKLRLMFGLGYELFSFTKHLVVLEDNNFPTRSFRPNHKVQSATSSFSASYRYRISDKSNILLGAGIDFYYITSKRVKNNTLIDDIAVTPPTSFGKYYVNYSSKYYYSPKLFIGSEHLLNNGHLLGFEISLSEINLNGGYSLSNDNYSYLERFSYDASKLSIGILYSINH